MRRLAMCTFVLAAAACGSSPSAPAFSVTLSAPSGTAYTNSSVEVVANVDGGVVVSHVELLVDGLAETSLPSAPYDFAWDTRDAGEGPHQVSARAWSGTLSATSDVREVVVDRTAPFVISMLPSPSGLATGLEAPVTVTFSEPLLPASVAATEVSLQAAGESLPSTVSLSADGRTLTIQGQAVSPSPAKPFDVTGSITAGPTDLAGNPASPQTWSWSVPFWFPIGGSLRDAGSSTVTDVPNLVTTPSGDLEALYTDFKSDPGAYYANVVTWHNGVWQPVGPPLHPGSFQGGMQNAMVLDPAGEPVVASLTVSATENNLYVQRWDGTAWQPFGGALVPASTAGLFEDVFVATDPSGNPWLAATVYDTAAGQTATYAFSWSGVSWQALGGAITPVNSFTAALAVDREGRGLVAAYEAGNIIRVHRWNGSSWDLLGTSVLGESNDVFSTVALLVDTDDNPTVGFFHEPGSGPELNVVHWDGTAWQPLGAPIAPVSSRPQPLGPSLLATADGGLIVSFSRDGPASTDAFVALWDGTTWQPFGPGIDASDGRSVQGQFLPVAVDGAGHIAVGFVECSPASSGPNCDGYVALQNE